MNFEICKLAMIPSFIANIAGSKGFGINAPKREHNIQKNGPANDLSRNECNLS